MAGGCTNPAAVNYDPEATEDNGSCVYLTEMNGECLQFEDIDVSDSVEDRNFTLSFDAIDKKWSFFHDYWPDYYLHTRKALYNIKNNTIYQHNAGQRGLYHNRSAAKPFFIDVLFNGKETIILNSVRWISEVRDGGNIEADENKRALYDQTITAITIWNNYQCSGRILLNKDNLALISQNNRNSEQNWSFNDFRNIALEDIQFLDTLFKDFAILNSAVDTDLPWYEKRLMQGKYFIIRFEFENSADKQITIHDVDIDADTSIRA